MNNKQNPLPGFPKLPRWGLTAWLPLAALLLGSSGKLYATVTTTINSAAITAQGGTTATYGTADSGITYTVTANCTGTGAGGTITPSIGTLPSGVTAAFSPTSRNIGNTTADETFTLTLTTTAAAAAQNNGAFTVTVTGSQSGSPNSRNVSGALTINPKALDITANADSKTYGTTKTYGTGQTAFTPGAGQLVNGNSVTSVTLTCNDGAPATAIVGSYSIIPSVAVGSGLGNYSIAYHNGTLTVNKAPLSVTATGPVGKTYGTALTAGTSGANFTYSTTQNGETVTGVTLTPTGPGVSATAAAGSAYAVTPSLATGPGALLASNYQITYNAYNGTVATAALSVTATGPVGKTYGTALTAGTSGANFTYSTTQNGETVTSVTLTPTGPGVSATAAAGSAYAVTPSLATGPGTFLASNYQITYNPYNGTVATATPTIGGVTPSQSISYGTASVTLSGTVSPAGPGENGGTVTVTINGFSAQNATISGGAGAFSVSYPTATIPSSATPYTITYAYGGDANLNAAADNTSTALTVTADVCDAPPSGLVSWWPAEGNACDIIGGNEATYQNAVSYVSGKVGEAFSFAADSAMVVVGNPVSLQLPAFTIEGWVKRSSGSAVTSDPDAVGGDAMLFGYGAGGYGFGMDSSGLLLLSKVDNSDVTSTAGVTDTDFHHVAVTLAGGTYAFYIDGAAAGSGSFSPTFTFTTSAAIGGRADHLNLANNESFLGAIDELSVYNGALSASDVLAIYNAQAAGKCAPQTFAVSGSVQIDGYTLLTATVNFVATDAGNNVLATWEGAVLAYQSSATFSYSLGSVPAATAHISVQPTTPPFYLRKRLGVSYSSCPVTLNFTGDNMLLGGDLNGDGQVDTLDYIILRNNWGQTSPEALSAADINGDGAVDQFDYLIMKHGWYKTNDPE